MSRILTQRAGPEGPLCTVATVPASAGEEVRESFGSCF
jgi:hypothetical protein